MAAASHLERMGRELKCPICLSLLNSAVSLTCNHVFCNPCIEKSMKAASNCPVCKLPYRRREIRPAPHMDNLVNVYKSMEVASGVNIFITQNAASTKIFGEDNQTGIHTREAQHNGNTHIVTLGSCSQKQHQGKGSKVASHTDQRSSRSNLVKPSFPTKKRVQVSPYPTSEARMEPEKLESGNVEIDQTKYKKFQKDMSVTCEKGEPLFSPFFWLREEEDLEKSTQQTDDNQLMYTPPDVPCFSDIKDSDDEVSDKISPKRADCIIRNNADFIDSEMFDWTQRPCSPELCSAPLAMQIQDTEEQDKTEEKAEAALMETTTGSKISANKREILHKKKKANKSSENKGPTITCTKKVSNATETRKRKRAKKTICEVTTTDIESDKVIMLQGENSSLLTSKRKPQENEQICSEASNQDKSAVTLSDGTELLPNRNKTRASTKKVGNAAETKKGKRAKKTVCEVPVANIESDKVAIEEGDNGNSLTLKKKPRKNEKISSEASIQDKSALTLSHGTELLPNSNKLRASTKKVSNATETRKSKSAMCEVTVANVELDKVTMQEDGNGNPVNLKRKPRKNEKKCSAASIEDKNAPPLPDGTELQANSNKYAHANDTTCEDIEKSRKKNSNLGRSSKRKCTSKTLVQTEKYGNKVKTGPGRGRLHTEQNNEGLISQLHAIWLPSGNEKEVSDRNTEKAYEDNNKKMPNSLKKVTFSVEDMPKDRCDGISLSANDKDAMRSQTFQETVGATEQLGMRNTAKMDQASSTLNGSILLKCKKSPSTICCAFCQSSDESEASGIMVHYLNRKPVVDNQQASTKVVHVHKNCTEWAPNVYFEDDNVINLETELSRSRRITCSCCGIKGAALGCYEKSCRKSFHVSCARLTPECRWDSENFVMLCPIHASCQLPNEKPRSHSRKKRKSAIERKSCTPQAKTTEECKSGSTLPWKSQKKFRNMVLCCSALTDVEKAIITEFEKLSGVTMLKNWDSSITHVIASTDENGACRRTLKFLMGVLEGKWILNVQWIKACIEAGELVDEQHYEISSDINGIREGPRLGRLRLLNKQPKLFEAYTFFFMGDFAPSYRGYLHDLVIAAGGKVLNRKPIAGNHETNVIIYSIELPDQSQASILDQRRAQAEELANSAEAVVASNSWVLNSIAGYKLQNIRE